MSPTKYIVINLYINLLISS